MADGIFNIARGKIGYLSNDGDGLSGGNSALVVVVLEAVEADDTLNNYDTLSALLAGSNTEATATNYARKTHAAADVTYSVNDTTNTAKTVIDTDDTWTSVTGTAFVKLLVCWDGDTTAGTDANIIPLTYHDFAVTPNGGDITANFDQTNGIWDSA